MAMKRWYLIALLVSLLLPAVAQADLDESKISLTTITPARRLNDTLRDLIGDINDELGEVKERGTGNVYYVDSGVGSDTYTGTKPEWALATLDAAVAKCTANNGDVIYVMQNHAETMGGANAVDLDVAGITVIGLGYGDDRPTFTFDTDSDEFVIGADNVVIYNLCFFPSVSNCTHAVTIEDGSDGCAVLSCEWLESTTAANEFAILLHVEVDANDLTVANCKATSADAVGATAWLYAGDGLVNRLHCYNNTVYGEFSNAPIWSDTVSLGVNVHDNFLTNLTASQFCIEFTGATLGVIVNNTCNASENYEVDPGSCYYANNDEGKILPESTSLYDVIGAFSGDGGAAQDDSVKASLDLVHTDLDKILTGTIQGTGAVLPANKSLYNILGAYTADGGADDEDTVMAHLDLILTDTGGQDTAAEMQPLVDPNKVLYDAPRIVSYTTEAMTAANGYDADDDPNIFTVTGTILARAFAVPSVKVTSTSTDTLELGVEGDTACLLIKDVVDGTAFDENFCWTLDQAPDTTSAEMDTNWVLIPNGLDVKLYIDDHALTAGVVTFYLQWLPLSANANVVAAAAASTQ